jgi:hypothetical protein
VHAAGIAQGSSTEKSANGTTNTAAY